MEWKNAQPGRIIELNTDEAAHFRRLVVDGKPLTTAMIENATPENPCAVKLNEIGDGQPHAGAVEVVALMGPQSGDPDVSLIIVVHQQGRVYAAEMAG